MKKIRIFLAFTAIILCLVSSGWYLWFRIYPRHLIKEPIAKFEKGFYDGQPKNYLKIIDRKSPLATRVRENLNELNDLFLLFEKGFKISYAHRVYLNKPEDPYYSQMIWAEVSKIAKLDGEYRNHFEVSLVRIEGEWKIHTYYFPDVIDYMKKT